MTARDDRLRELAMAATPGPWLHDEAGYRAPDWPEDMHYRRVVRGEPHPVSGWRECVVSTHGAVDETAGARRNEVTAAYIAAASPDVVLGLLDRLAAVEAERDDLRAGVEALADEWQAVYDRWKGTNPGPRVAIFNVHARKVRGLLASSAPATASEPDVGQAYRDLHTSVRLVLAGIEAGTAWFMSDYERAGEGISRRISGEAAAMIVAERGQIADDLRDLLASSAPATASEGATEYQPCSHECNGCPKCDPGLATGVTSSGGDRGLSEEEAEAIERAVCTLGKVECQVLGHDHSRHLNRLIPLVTRIKAAAVDEAVEAALIVGATRAQPESTTGGEERG